MHKLKENIDIERIRWIKNDINTKSWNSEFEQQKTIKEEKSNIPIIISPKKVKNKRPVSK